MNEYDEQEDRGLDELSDGADEILRYLDDEPDTALNLSFRLLEWEKEDVIDVAEELVGYGLLESRYSGANLTGHDRVYSLTEDGEEYLEELDD